MAKARPFLPLSCLDPWRLDPELSRQNAEAATTAWHMMDRDWNTNGSTSSIDLSFCRKKINFAQNN